MNKVQVEMMMDLVSSDFLLSSIMRRKFQSNLTDLDSLIHKGWIRNLRFNGYGEMYSVDRSKMQELFQGILEL